LLFLIFLKYVTGYFKNYSSNIVSLVTIAIMNFKCKLRQFRYDIRHMAMNYPSLYSLLTKFGDGYGKLAYSETEVVIEGFPRSANTFAFLAFKLSQKENLKIAHHKHSITQLLLAKQYNIPTILLIRHPEQAVVSFVIREPCISLKSAFKYWIIFYKKLLKYKEFLVIADFEEVTTDFGKVIERVNQRFDTQFEKFEHTTKNIEQCFEKMEAYQNQVNENSIARPSLERKQKKEELRIKLSDPSLQSLKREANQIYNRYFR